MRNPSQVPSIAPHPGQAAQRPIPGQVSAAENPAPAAMDSPAEAEGRRTLSTAFVRLGAGGHLTVALRDGSEVVLRDVVMGARDYCGVRVGDMAGKRYCGGYGEVAAARPGGGPTPGTPDPATLDPVAPVRSR